MVGVNVPQSGYMVTNSEYLDEMPQITGPKLWEYLGEVVSLI